MATGKQIIRLLFASPLAELDLAHAAPLLYLSRRPAMNFPKMKDELDMSPWINYHSYRLNIEDKPDFSPQQSDLGFDTLAISRVSL
jgi:hypothetical protein